VIGGCLGVLAGVCAGAVAADWQEAREVADMQRRTAAFEASLDVAAPPPAEGIRALLAQSGRVVVEPALADRIGEADLATAEELLASSDVDLHLAYLRAPYDRSLGYYIPSSAVAQWAAGVGETGHYVVLFDDGTLHTAAVGLEDGYVFAQSKGQPGPALVRVAEEMTTLEAEPLTLSEPSGSDYWGGVGGGIGAALLFGGLLVVPAFLALRFAVSRRGG
jgi:hypothetical protein